VVIVCAFLRLPGGILFLSFMFCFVLFVKNKKKNEKDKKYLFCELGQAASS
jgi:hypothetical protein